MISDKELLEMNVTKQVRKNNLGYVLAKNEERVLCVIVRETSLYYLIKADEKELINKVIHEIGFGSNLTYNKHIFSDDRLTVIVYE